MDFSCDSRISATLAICLAGMVSACSPPDSPRSQSRDQAQTIESGAALFEENCGVCHGAGGRGPALETLQALSPEELRNAIRNHPVAGPVPGRMPANEVSDLVEFLDQ